MYSDQLMKDFSSHLSTKGALLSSAERTAQIENFRNGVNFAQAFMDRHESIAKCTALQIVEFIQALHALTTDALYQHQSDEKAGHFRHDESFVLRHPRSDAGYDGVTQYGRIAKFLKNYVGPAIALAYLTGYYKFFILGNPKVPVMEVEKFQKGIGLFASSLDVPFDPRSLATPMNDHERTALDKVYKIFSPKKEISTKILEWATALIRDLQAKEDPREIFARYYRTFIDIHPFIDGNSRTISLFLNVILLENGYSPLFLQGELAHRFCDHYFDQAEPDIAQFISYVKKQISAPETYRSLGYVTQTTLFLQHITHAEFASFQNMAREDRIAVAAIFRPDSEAIKDSITSKLAEARIPYSLKGSAIFVPDINSNEVATSIQNAFYEFR